MRLVETKKVKVVFQILGIVGELGKENPSFLVAEIPLERKNSFPARNVLPFCRVKQRCTAPTPPERMPGYESVKAIITNKIKQDKIFLRTQHIIK